MDDLLCSLLAWLLHSVCGTVGTWWHGPAASLPARASLVHARQCACTRRERSVGTACPRVPPPLHPWWSPMNYIYYIIHLDPWAKWHCILCLISLGKKVTASTRPSPQVARVGARPSCETNVATQSSSCQANRLLPSVYYHMAGGIFEAGLGDHTHPTETQEMASKVMTFHDSDGHWLTVYNPTYTVMTTCPQYDTDHLCWPLWQRTTVCRSLLVFRLLV